MPGQTEESGKSATSTGEKRAGTCDAVRSGETNMPETGEHEQKEERDTDSMRGMMGGDVSEGIMLCKADACVSVSKRRWGDDESPSRRWVEERQAGL